MPAAEKSYLRTGNRNAAIRLLAFHHGGGSALSFLPLARSLPEECETFIFELAGRAGDADRITAADYEEAYTRFAADAVDVVDRPVVVIGHSLGALFAHNVACLLPDAQRELVRTVIVSASRSAAATAETAPMPAEPFVVRSRASLLGELRNFGGVRPEFLEDADFVDAAVTLLGHDLHLADTYTLPQPGPTSVPHQVWYGTDDATLSREERARWNESCLAPPVHRGFPGGHFYLYERPEAGAALAELVAGTVAAAAGSSA
ncbi:thioesterase II family protein [Streptomyces akebiae]|uniref:Alpha/beta fold hydrolase n=1 Tax=Streptomyces akebiae TaxID=2865673 RepID=A0ABX8XUW3_9ACTN|nr:alpha/beta fold hydrolase [Streptomyces akebiae]QYX79580.1 alpha/beta fold hydrolase [Streptomyces akebiae]